MRLKSYSENVLNQLEVTATSVDKDDLSEIFGIISVWKYAGSELGTFDCDHLFHTPEIVPFKDISNKN